MIVLMIVARKKRFMENHEIRKRGNDMFKDQFIKKTTTALEQQYKLWTKKNKKFNLLPWHWVIKYATALLIIHPRSAYQQ